MCQWIFLQLSVFAWLQCEDSVAELCRSLRTDAAAWRNGLTATAQPLSVHCAFWSGLSPLHRISVVRIIAPERFGEGTPVVVSAGSGMLLLTLFAAPI